MTDEKTLRGERFWWHGHHRTLKNMYQALAIPPWERHHPLIFVNDVLAAIGDLVVDPRYQSTPGLPLKKSLHKQALSLGIQ